MKRCLLLLVLLLGCSPLIPAMAQEPIIQIPVNAGDIPPMCYLQDGNPAGVAVEILGAVAKSGRIKFDLSVFPWARAQIITQEAKEPQGIIPLSRTAERESKYSWPLELYTQKMVFVTTGDIPPPETLDAAKKMRIGTLQDNMYADHLAAMGFSRVEFVATENLNAKKLHHKRIDAWLVSDLVAKYTYALATQTDGSDLHFGVPLGEPFHVYLGGTRSFPDDLKAELNETMEKLKADNTISTILNKYK